MQQLIDMLQTAGLRPSKVVLHGEEVELTWQAQSPILDDRVMIALPDLHLGDGGPADIFRGAGNTNANRARLEDFLAVLIQFKAGLLAQGRRLSVVQLGDCFDVWRAFPFHEQVPGRTYDAIETEYRNVVARLIDGLDARFCVGNHDAVLGQYPPDWAFGANSRLGYSQRFCNGRVFCLHGHQTNQVVEGMAAGNGQVWVALGSVLCSISNPIGQALQQLIDRSEDTYPGDDGGWPLGDPPADSPFAASRWSDRGGRERRLENILGGMRQTCAPIADAVRLVLTGHTHRPGISWFTLGDRVLAVMDVGTWTYGKTHFAILVEGKATLWQIG